MALRRTAIAALVVVAWACVEGSLLDAIRAPPAAKTTVKRSLAVPASVGNGTVFVPALIYASEYKRHQTAELVARALRAGFRGVDRRRLFFRLLRRGPALGRVDAAVLGGSSRHGGLAVRTPKSR